MLFPFERMGRDNKFYLQVIADHAEATLHNVQWSEMAKWFATFVDQTSDLCSEPIWPKYQHGLVRSLYMLGAATHSSGFKLRPVLPGQDTLLFPVLSIRVKRFHQQSYVEIPPIPLTPSVSIDVIKRELVGTWDERSKRAHRGAIEIRRWKKNPQRQLVP